MRLPILIALTFACLDLAAQEKESTKPGLQDSDFHNFKLPNEGPMPARAPDSLTDCSNAWWQTFGQYYGPEYGRSIYAQEWERYSGVGGDNTNQRELALRVAEKWARQNDYLPCKSLQMCGAVLKTIPGHLAVNLSTEESTEGSNPTVGFGPDATVLIDAESYTVVDSVIIHLGCTHYEKQMSDEAN